VTLDALYGAQAAAKLSRQMAQTVALTSLNAVPPAVNPWDTQKMIQAQQKAAADKAWMLSPLMGLLVLVLIVWAVIAWLR
jgi:hypothetical protein